jgi:hypothetical protein
VPSSGIDGQGTAPTSYRVDGRETGAWPLLAALAAPALVLLAIVVQFLKYHEYGLLYPESLILMGGALAAGALLGALARLRPATLEPILIAVAIGAFALHQDQVWSWLKAAKEGIPLPDLYGAALVLVGGFVGLSLVCWALRTHLKNIVVAVFGTIVLTTLALPTATGGEPVESGAPPAVVDATLPPVIHVILDEHIGLAAVPSEIEGSVAAGEAVRSVYRDFAIYDRAYSRFAETAYSLASLMNGGAEGNAAELLEQQPAGWTLLQNGWFEELARRGYAIRVYQSAWLDMCANASVASCYTYPLFSPNAIQRSSLSTSARLGVLTTKLLMSETLPQLSPLASVEAMARFQADLAEAPHGVAYVVHLLLPHSGYLYRKDCSLADPAEWRSGPTGEDHQYSPAERAGLYRLYLAQLACAAGRVETILDQLRRLGVYDEATVIVHGDHGSRIGERPHLHTPVQQLTGRDILDHYATLFAVKAPDIAPGARGEPAELQDVFGATFLGRKAQEATGEVLVRTGRDTFVDAKLTWPPAGASDEPDVSAAPKTSSANAGAPARPAL